jgi:hypothetical protein
MTRAGRAHDRYRSRSSTRAAKLRPISSVFSSLSEMGVRGLYLRARYPPRRPACALSSAGSARGGRVNVAGQVFTASLAHVGRLLTVVIEEHQFRVLADGAPLKVVARKPRRPELGGKPRRSSPTLQTAQQRQPAPVTPVEWQEQSSRTCGSVGRHDRRSAVTSW